MDDMTDWDKLDAARRVAADELFEGHDYAPYAFEATSGWTYTTGGGETEWTRPAFLLDPDKPDGDSVTAAFVVRFADTSDTVVDSYCILDGELVGKPSASPAP